MYFKKDEMSELAELLKDVDSPLAEKIRKTVNPEPIIINCTPHPITIIGTDGSVIREFPSAAPENVCRVVNARVVTFTVGGVPIFGLNAEAEITGQLPPEKKGVYYIVSRMCADAMANRNDLLVPDQNVVIGGERVGCRGLLWV